MIHILIGTKGQFIKTIPVLQELEKRNIDYNFIHTSQHYDITFKILKIFNAKSPDYFLSSKKNDLENIIQAIPWFMSCLIKGVNDKKNMWKNKKGIVVVHGDTESTLLGVILAKLSGMKVAHIEAGLRSHDIFNPFPEEIIRIITSRFSDYLFAPSDLAIDNIRKYKNQKIYNTHGNTVFDSLSYIKKITKKNPSKKPYKFLYAVASLHRKETLYNRKLVEKAISYIEIASKKNHIVFILHKNTLFTLKKYDLLFHLEKNKNVILKKSFLDYLSFMELIIDSEFVITDGGGLQEETYYLNKPCLILRKKTERKYGLGETACLSRFDGDEINYFLNNYREFHRKKNKEEIYNPSKIIVQKLIEEEVLIQNQKNKAY
ncbi:MAG: UDP-N-acetylglucosamine 2-epimerase [Patescibacteria group bacterium]|nr:UDP-N-acetylglucosamine 2-epimerase [Patescibacteria group bacterium]